MLLDGSEFLKRLEPLRARLEHNRFTDDSFVQRRLQDGTKVHWALAVQTEFSELKGKISVPLGLIDVLLNHEAVYVAYLP